MAATSDTALKDYVETRLNLLTKAIEADAKAVREELHAYAEAAKIAQAASDLRYQQRYEAQSDALTAAFLSQQTAMKTALDAAKEAVQAALAAADRAVSKTELSADKRFESLIELTKQQFFAMGEKFDALAKHVAAVELRITGFTGEKIGGKEKKEDTRNTWLLALAVIGGLLGLISFLTK